VIPHQQVPCPSTVVMSLTHNKVQYKYPPNFILLNYAASNSSTNHTSDHGSHGDEVDVKDVPRQ